jgi:hypothetical protein
VVEGSLAAVQSVVAREWRSPGQGLSPVPLRFQPVRVLATVRHPCRIAVASRLCFLPPFARVVRPAPASFPPKLATGLAGLPLAHSLPRVRPARPSPRAANSLRGVQCSRWRALCFAAFSPVPPPIALQRAAIPFVSRSSTRYPSPRPSIASPPRRASQGQPFPFSPRGREDLKRCSPSPTLRCVRTTRQPNTRPLPIAAITGRSRKGTRPITEHFATLTISERGLSESE